MANGRCLLGIRHWREVLSQSEAVLESLNDTVTKLRLSRDYNSHIIAATAAQVRARTKLKICPKVDSTICFCVLMSHTARVTEVEEMFNKQDSLKHEYALNQRWAVTRMIQSYESDEKLAYIHGFDAGIDLLCAKAEFSNPAIAEGVRELARGMAEETAKTLRSLIGEKKEIIVRLALYQR
jgi:hypothetical protein